MAAGINLSLTFAVIWLALCLVAWLAAHRGPTPWSCLPGPLIVGGSAAIARLVPAFILDRGLAADVEAHWRVGIATLAGVNVYTAPLTQDRYPYPPLHMYLSALMVWLAGGDHARFLVIDKLVPALCGVALSMVLWAIARREGRSAAEARTIGLLYALNPLPILVTSYHGQFEEIPLLCVAIAWLLATGRRWVVRSVVVSGSLLGVAIAYKTWPVLFLSPLLFLAYDTARGIAPARQARRRIALGRSELYLATALMPLVVALGLYGVAFGPNFAGLREAVTHMVGYRGPTAFCWGYVGILHRCWDVFPSPHPAMWVQTLCSGLLPLALLAAGVLLLVRRRPLEAMVTFPLAFYLFTPGWGPNYSIWVLPFLMLLSIRLGWWYTASVLPVVSLTYFDLLYAANDPTFVTWRFLKPVEALLGLLAWLTLAVVLIKIHLGDGRGIPPFLHSWRMGGGRTGPVPQRQRQPQAATRRKEPKSSAGSRGRRRRRNEQYGGLGQ